MTPRTALGRTAAVAALVLGTVLLVGLAAAVAWTAYWVDVVPGADAGLATSPQLEAGRRAVAASGIALLALGAGTGAVLLRVARRSAGARSQRG